MEQTKYKTFGKHLKVFWFVIKYEWQYLLIFALYILLTYISPFVLLVFPKDIIDGLAVHEPMGTIFNRIILMAFSYLLINLSIKALSVAKADMEMKLKVRLNVAMSEKCMKLKITDLEDGDVINTINSARMAINGGLTYTQAMGLSGEQGIAGYFTHLADIVSNILKGLTYLYILSRLPLWIIGVILIGLLFTGGCQLMKKHANLDLRKFTAPFLRKNQYCNRTLRSFEAGKDIRLYHLEEFLLDKFSECNNNYVNAKNKYRGKFVLSEVASVFCNVTVAFCIYFSLIRLLSAGEISVGEFTMTAGAAISLFTCVSTLITEFMELDIFGIYLADFQKLMSRQEEVWSGGRPLKKGPHKIVFENVSFSYDNATEEALSNINLTIEGGDTISVVGANGAGKSTFVKLLTGLICPGKGTITIDGYPMGEYCRKDLVEHMSVLFQDFKTYAMSVEENVTMSTDCHRELFEKSISESGIKERIELLAEREKTPLSGYFGGNDVVLSGGEEQKLALARAYYKDSELLILDEPTAALDALSECDIYESMLEHIKGKTVLFVSHRMACTRFCSRILVFDKGKIAETGSHDELIGQNGLYASMWEAQARHYE